MDEMVKREIHIWNLPENKIYIKLKEDYKEKFFDKVYKKFDNWNKIGKKLKIKRPDTILARNWKNGTCSFPLQIAFKICNLTGIPRLELEKNILEVRYKERLYKRGGSSGKPLKNPRFPIRVDKNFVEIIGHVCGDGSIPNNKKRTGIPFCYSNSQIELIENFKELIYRKFGEVEPNVCIRDGKNYRRPNYYLRYPTILSTIILMVFKGKKEPLEFPYYLTKTKENKISFLRAIYDDEGDVNIKNKQMVLGMKSKDFITGCKSILNDLNIKTGGIIQVKNKEYYTIGIGQGRSIRRFNRLIKLNHPTKRDKIYKILKIGWKFERYDNGVAKQEIKNFLKQRAMDLNEISNKLKRNPGTIKAHLRELEKRGEIKSYFGHKEDTFYKSKMWSVF